MFRLCIAITVTALLTGCGATNPLSKIKNLADKNLGEVAAINNGDDIKEYGFYEAERVRQWKGIGTKCFKDDSSRTTFQVAFEYKVDELLENYGKYCSSIGGVFSELGYIDYDDSAKQVQCKNIKTSAPMFAVNMGVSRGDGGCNYPFNNSVLIWTDAFQWKVSGGFEDIKNEFTRPIGLLHPRGFSRYGLLTKSVFNDAVLREREADLQEREYNKARYLATVQANEREWDEQKEKERKLLEQAVLNQPKVRTVGQKVCRLFDISQRKVIGEVMGKPAYGQPVQVKAKVTGFTENSSGRKIQIRISGMQANGESMERIDGDVVLENGAVIWDDSMSWAVCN